MSKTPGKIAVIGLGRVGLPFAISLYDAGFSVVGIDNNDNWVNRLCAGGDFPFHEPGYDALPTLSDRWDVRNHFNDMEDVDAFFVTVGTPLDSNLTPNLQPIKQVIGSIQNELAKGKLLIFRSTLGLDVTTAISKYLQAIGACLNDTPNIAYCPERLAEGKAREEIKTLPQIVSAGNEESRARCHEIFSRIAPAIHDVSFKQAELIKLLCNTSRYMNFAVSNWVHEFVLEHGVDPHTLLAIANDRYPRPIPDRPGFTAGTCLRKDYGLLVQDQIIGDYALAAWRVNERQPLALLNAAARNCDLVNSKVCVMGVGFKRDVDDLRDSLALKMAELFMPRSKDVFFHDPFVKADYIDLGLTPMYKVDYDTVEKEADVLVIGANHSEYDTLAERMEGWKTGRKRLVIDIWNVSGFGHTITEIEA